MSSTNRGGRRRPRDNYITPYWCIDVLCQRLVRGLYDRVIDLGAGDGRIGVAVRDAVSANTRRPAWLIDLKQGPKLKSSKWITGDITSDKMQDVIHCEAYNSNVLIVSNPPFTLAKDFVKIANRMIDFGAGDSEAWFLLPLNWFSSFDRLFLADMPPEQMVTLVPRPSFTAGFLEIDPGERGNWFCKQCGFEVLTTEKGKCTHCGRKVIGSTDSNEYGWFRWSQTGTRDVGNWFHMGVRDRSGGDGSQAERVHKRARG
jgi:hypothetical protein